MIILKKILKQIAFYLKDFLAPFLVHLRTPKEAKTSRARVLELIHYMKPLGLSIPLERFGPIGDGGYLAPNDFDGVVACFSPGVSDVAGFELDLARVGIPCYLIDASVERAPVEHRNIYFDRYFLGPESDGERFISLADWVRKEAPLEGDLVLQIDIEGAEYQALLATPDEILNRFRLIVIELHDLEIMMTSKYSALGLEEFLKKVKSLFEVVHIHPNNNRRVTIHEGIELPSVIEMTLLRKDRFSKFASAEKVQLPHPLDSQNSPRRSSVTFSRDWVNGILS